MKKLIVLNHKMNLEYDEVYAYMDKLNQIETENNIVVCPSNIYLESFMNHCTWGVGAQDVSYRLGGNYTGEVSCLQLKSLGVEYSLIGHYERKKYCHESNKQIRKKLNACLDSNIMPILCFGETGNMEDIYRSLDELLEGISNIEFIVFAYEPLQVIEEEDLELVREQVDEIYSYLYEKYQCVPNLIYGGGINQRNIKELFRLEKLNGILIGKVSSEIEKIEKIIKAVD